MRVALTLLILCFVCCTPAFADQVYQVTGTVTLTGNNACSGLCTEILDFSFLVTYQPDCCGTLTQIVLPGSTTTSIGPLAPFALGAAPVNYFAFFNSAHDEIDVFGPGFDGERTAVPYPNLIGAELYSCGYTGEDALCVTDFVPPGDPGAGHVKGASLVYSVSAVPELSTLGSLIAGGGVLLLLGVRRTSNR
jgi:hypothetical protein